MRFLAIEHCLPSKAVTNEAQLEDVILKSEAYLSAHDLRTLRGRLQKNLDLTRTRVRYLRGPNETARDVGIRAGQLALHASGLNPKDIDLLLYAGVARGFLEPATATIFQDALGLVNSSCFDLLDACASWLRALDTAHALIKMKKHETVMILNCECNYELADLAFRHLEDIDFKFPMLTIGEAATATIVTSSGGEDSYYATFKSWGQHRGLCQIPLPHYRQFENGSASNDLQSLTFYSYGERLFKVVFRKIIEHYRSDQRINLFEPDIVFSHSASDAFSERVAQALDLRNVYLTHSLFGNTVAASIPLGMSHAIKHEILKPGMSVLIGCGSAGITTAWCRFEYTN